MLRTEVPMSRKGGETWGTPQQYRKGGETLRLRSGQAMGHPTPETFERTLPKTLESGSQPLKSQSGAEAHRAISSLDEGPKIR